MLRKSQIPVASPRATKSARGGSTGETTKNLTSYRELYRRQNSMISSARTGNTPSPMLHSNFQDPHEGIGRISGNSAITKPASSSCPQQLKVADVPEKKSMEIVDDRTENVKKHVGSEPGDCFEFASTSAQFALPKVHSEGDSTSTHDREKEVEFKNLNSFDEDAHATEKECSVIFANTNTLGRKSSTCQLNQENSYWENDHPYLPRSKTTTVLKKHDDYDFVDVEDIAILQWGKWNEQEKESEMTKEKPTNITPSLTNFIQEVEEFVPITPSEIDPSRECEEWMEKVIFPIDENGNMSEEHFRHYYPDFNLRQKSPSSPIKQSTQIDMGPNRKKQLQNNYVQEVATPGKNQRIKKTRQPSSLEAAEKWMSKIHVNPVQYNPSLNVSSFVSLTRDDDLTEGKDPRFSGLLAIENHTDLFYGIKFSCNKSAYGKYFVTPKEICIGPHKALNVVIQAKEENFSDYLAAGDFFTVRGYPLKKNFEGPELHSYLKKLNLRWPQIGEKFRVIPKVIEEGPSEITDMVDFSEPRVKLEILSEIHEENVLIPKRNFGASINDLNMTLRANKLLLTRLSKDFQNLMSQRQIVICIGTIGLLAWKVFPFFFDDKDDAVVVKEIEAEVEESPAGWFTWPF